MGGSMRSWGVHAAAAKRVSELLTTADEQRRWALLGGVWRRLQVGAR